MSDRQMIDFLVEQNEFKCNICNKNFGNFERFKSLNYPRREYGIHLDHVILSRITIFFSNLQWRIDEVDNRQLLCINCNVRKGRTTDEQYLERMRNVCHAILDFNERKLIKPGEEYWEKELIEGIKSNVVSKKITREDMLRGFAYRKGRLFRVTEEDKEMLKEFCDYINFDFKKI